MDVDSDRYKRVNKNSYKATFGKTRKQISAENRHIIATQKKCLRFVKKHTGHMAVCNWCKKAKSPKVIWKWDASSQVWYRFYDGKWHWWGESKKGFTAIGWTWYKGYWHHRGWVFKYVNGFWYRFQGGRWVRYARKVPVKPSMPRGKPICRPFYKLRKYGFPISLALRRLPRCVVGAGRRRHIYMWRNRASCRFLGGKLVYFRHHTCKAGRPHQWSRVIRCVKGPILSKTGFDYKTGKMRVRRFAKSKTKKEVVLGGMVLGSCYRMTSPYIKGMTTPKFRVTRGANGKRNSVSFWTPNKSHIVYNNKGALAQAPRKRFDKNRASFYVLRGLVSRRSRLVSFMDTMGRRKFISPLGGKRDMSKYQGLLFRARGTAPVY